MYRLTKTARNPPKLIMHRYGVTEEEWETLGETPIAKNSNTYLTLLPIFNGRYIAVLGDLMPRFFDCSLKDWIKCELVKGSHPVVPRQYPGAF